MKKFTLLIILCFGLLEFTQAQKQDSTASALNNANLPEVVAQKWIPNPGKALRLGLVLPGAGQIYDRRWWKLPLVYAAYGGIIYAIDYNQGWLNRFKTAFDAQVQNPPEDHEFTPLGLNSTELKAFRDKFDKQLQLSYIGLIIAHGLVSMEAFVDAHLQSFDISDDLTLQVQPEISIDPFTRQPVFSVVGTIDF
jgi:hypothetical protein